MRRTTRWWVGLMALATLGSCGTYLAAHARDAPPPMWRRTDLGPVPATQDNGWRYVRDVPPEAEAAVTWVRGVSLGYDERAHLTDDTRELVDGVTEKPRFVQECASLPCMVTGSLELHALRMMHVSFAIETDRPRAFRVLDAAWRHAIDFTEHAQTQAGFEIGLEMLESTLEHLRNPDPPRLDDVADQVRALADAVEAARLPDALTQQGVIATYVEFRHDFDRGEGGMLFDERSTMLWVDRAYTDLHAYAAATGGRSPLPLPFRDSSIWWVYNYQGRRWADLYSAAFEFAARDIDSQHFRLETIRAALAPVAEALRSRVR